MRRYMAELRARGQLLEVRREVQARHELAAVTQAATRRHGKPTLFHHVSGTKLPVLTNIYGSRERLAGGADLRLRAVDERGGLTDLFARRDWNAVFPVAYRDFVADFRAYLDTLR